MNIKHQILNHKNNLKNIVINFQMILVINLNLVKLVFLMDLVNGINQNALISLDVQHLMKKITLDVKKYLKDV